MGSAVASPADNLVPSRASSCNKAQFYFFHKRLPDGTPAVADSASLWKSWLSWEKLVVSKLGVTQYTSTLERSLHSATADRVHFDPTLAHSKGTTQKVHFGVPKVSTVCIGGFLV